MNIEPGGSVQRKKRRSSDADIANGVKALCSLVARVVHAALIIAVLGVLFHTYIKLDQECDAVTAEILNVNNKITRVEAEIQGLNGVYANRTRRSYIVRQIARFRLPLTESSQDQRRQMQMYSKEQLARIDYPLYSSDVAVGAKRTSSRMNGVR